MFSRILFNLMLMPLVLSEPDLCRNPKLDSITYVWDKKIWFFTSGGHYWYVKENDFPPGQPRGKLPEEFSRGDAAFYCDFMNVCPKARQKIKRSDQMVYLVEKVGDKNKVIEFDVRNLNWAQNSHELKTNNILGQTKIEIEGQIDAIFTKNDSEVYVVQKTTYAAIDWKNLCSGSTDFAKAYEPGSVDALQSAEGSYDAIAVKEEFMYSFIGSNFWKSKIVAFQSKNGKIVIQKGHKQNVSSDFFKFKECTAVVVPDPSGQQTPSPDNTNEGNGGPPDSPELDPEKEPNSDTNPKSESSGGGLVFLIIIIVVVIIVVGVVIGVVVLLMRGKSEPEANKGNGPPPLSSKAKGPKPSKK